MYYVFMGALCIPMFVLAVLQTDFALVLAFELLAVLSLCYFGYLAIQREGGLKFFGFVLIVLSLVAYYYFTINPLVTGNVFVIKF